MHNKTTFDAATYLHQFYKPSQGPNPINHIENKFNQWSKQAFDIIEPCQYGIQIGCGPILILSGYASRKVRNIFLTEYNTDCFKFFTAWMRKQKNQYNIDWSQEFQIIANLEGTHDNIEERLRKSLVGCLKIDLNLDQVFEYPIFKKFDIIFSRLCLECAATDNNHFKRAIGNLKKYMKVNGYLLLLGLLDEDFYIVGQQKITNLLMKKQILVQSMDQNGLQIIKFDQYWPQNPPTKYGNWRGLYCLLAKLPDTKSL